MEQTDKNAFYYTTPHILYPNCWTKLEQILHKHIWQAVNEVQETLFLRPVTPSIYTTLIQSFHWNLILYLTSCSITVFDRISCLTEYQEHWMKHKLATATLFQAVLVIPEHSKRTLNSITSFNKNHLQLPPGWIRSWFMKHKYSKDHPGWDWAIFWRYQL